MIADGNGGYDAVGEDYPDLGSPGTLTGSIGAGAGNFAAFGGGVFQQPSQPPSMALSGEVPVASSSGARADVLNVCNIDKLAAMEEKLRVAVGNCDLQGIATVQRLAMACARIAPALAPQWSALAVKARAGYIQVQQSCNRAEQGTPGNYASTRSVLRGNRLPSMPSSTSLTEGNAALQTNFDPMAGHFDPAHI